MSTLNIAGGGSPETVPLYSQEWDGFRAVLSRNAIFTPPKRGGWEGKRGDFEVTGGFFRGIYFVLSAKKRTFAPLNRPTLGYRVGRFCFYSGRKRKLLDISHLRKTGEQVTMPEIQKRKKADN